MGALWKQFLDLSQLLTQILSFKDKIFPNSVFNPHYSQSDDHEESDTAKIKAANENQSDVSWALKLKV